MLGFSSLSGNGTINISKLSPYTPLVPLSPPNSEKNFNLNDRTSEDEMAPNAMVLDSPTKRIQKSPTKNDISRNLSKLYPNLLNNNSTDDPKFNSLIKKFSVEQTQNNIMCHICQKYVNEISLFKHLYFGSVYCLDCGKMFNNCSVFASVKSKSKNYKCCKHNNLNYEVCPFSQIKKFIRSSTAANESFDELLQSYLLKLKPLENFNPWNTALHQCFEYLKSDMIKIKKVKATTNNKLPNAPKENGKRGEQIKLPSNGFYLILQEPIEECPNCYEPLDIKNFIYKLSNGLIFTNCHGCALSIYFVINPPDGNKPKVCILQSDSQEF